MLSLIACLLLTLIPTRAHAGDIPEGIIALDDVDVVLGIVDQLDGDTTILEVKASMFGLIDEGAIRIPKMKLPYIRERDNVALSRKPQVGEACMAMLQIQEDGGYELFYNLCAAADGTDPATVMLSPSKGFIEWINRNINDGTYSPEQRAARQERMRANSTGALVVAEAARPAASTGACPSPIAFALGCARSRILMHGMFATITLK